MLPYEPLNIHYLFILHAVHFIYFLSSADSTEACFVRNMPVFLYSRELFSVNKTL